MGKGWGVYSIVDDTFPGKEINGKIAKKYEHVALVHVTLFTNFHQTRA